MSPSQPSLQMQVNVSPPPTHVPPFRQGLDAQVLFFAEVNDKMEKRYSKWASDSVD